MTSYCFFLYFSVCVYVSTLCILYTVFVSSTVCLLWLCMGCYVVRRACYTLTGQDHWSEMHDGILWWGGRVWINMLDFSSPCCVCVSVCASRRERDLEACLFELCSLKLFIEALMNLFPSQIFTPLVLPSFLPLENSQVYLLVPCWLPLQTLLLIPSYPKLLLH